MITIDLNTPVPILQGYLESKGWLMAGETVLSVGKPGEGNMNVVLRVKTDRRSFILKQSRPYVNKYPQIPAPLARISVENQFYTTIKDDSISSHIPAILGYEPSDHVLALEDLGEVEDMTQLYATGIIEDHIAKKLIEIIATIHRSKPGAAYPLNARLRQLNHQHIFVLPFLEDNGFELDEVQPGLQELSLTYKQDKALKKEVESVGNRYLAEGDTLLHGDYYPGSWMTANNRVYVIDPEFSFMGFPEFDLGVMSAHCVMATMDPGILQRIMDGYSGQAETKLVEKVAGIEIIRRLIGLAQLPLTRTLDEKAHLLQLAGEMVME